MQAVWFLGASAAYGVLFAYVATGTFLEITLSQLPTEIGGSRSALLTILIAGAVVSAMLSKEKWASRGYRLVAALLLWLGVGVAAVWSQID